MNTTIKIFKTIKGTSSLNTKSAILEQNKDNKFFIECLKFLLDDMIVTGISTKKYNKFNISSSDFKHNDINSEFLNLLNYIKTHNTGRDTDILLIKSWAYGMSKDIQEFTEQLLTKSYKLGCNAKVVNKVIPDLIPTFEVQLGTSIEKVKIKEDCWIALSRKLNGSRTAFVGDRCMTRQGKEYKGLDHIIKDLLKLGLQNKFVDGELLYKNEEGLTDSEAFQKGVGIAMSKDKDKTKLKLIVFDVFPLEEFWKGTSKDTYKTRKQFLLKLKEDITDSNIKNIEIVPMVYEGNDHSEIWKWLNYAEENDWEGIMVNLDTPYECKRTKNLIKVKQFKTCDLKCIDIEEGVGRNKGLLGSIVCSYKGYKLNVGSGFSDAKRKEIWENPSTIVGKIVTVKYKEETQNKDGGLSIQFPVYETTRFDKDEESYN